MGKGKHKGGKAPGKALVTAAMPATPERLADLMAPRMTTGPTPATPARAVTLPAVWACVDSIASTTTQIPLMMTTGRDRMPVPEWLRKPERWNDDTATLTDIVEALTVGQSLHGAGYLWAEPMGQNAWQLFIIDPQRVTVEVEQTGNGRQRKTYRVDGSTVPTARRYTTKANSAGLLVINHRTLPGIAEGVGPIQAARYSIAGYMETETYGSDVFGSGVPQGTLTSDQEITRETAVRYRDDWMNDARETIRVLGNGLAFTPFKLNPRDAAWLEARRYDGEEIARLFLVPAYKLNLAVSGGLTYNNPESLERDYIRGCIGGYCRPIEDGLNKLTGPGRNAAEESAIKFDYSGLLRATTSERYAAYSQASGEPWLLPDEIRALEGLPPLAESGA